MVTDSGGNAETAHRKPTGFLRNARIGKIIAVAAAGLLRCSEIDADSGPGKGKNGPVGHLWNKKDKRNASDLKQRPN